MAKNYSLTVKIVKTNEVNSNARNTSSVCCCGCHHTISKRVDGTENNPICYAIEGLSGYVEEGKIAYMHSACLEPLRYHANERIENITGTQNTTELRLGDISCEFELYKEGYQNPTLEEFRYLITTDKIFARVYISSLFLGSKSTGHAQQATHDCSVTTETPLRNMDLCSPSKWLHNMTNEAFKLLNNDNCGGHIHVNSNHCGYNTITKTIYKEVLRRIENMGRDDRIKYFGSDFRYYADDCVGNDHYSTINLEPSTGCTIEFRLARVRNADQYIQCCKWWRATVQVVNKHYHKVVNGIWTAEHLGKKAAQQIDRLYAGAFRKGE
ncbi:MAG: hypothetical protein J6S67_04730 [Methanobrevibacter sp.]|nr:hypothetical protein [Methanobrevibacter sp.]